MQLMPKTYRAMRDRYGLGTDPFDPQDNILAGTAYLRSLYERYGYPDLFAAYQAGPKRLEAWLDGRKPLPASTQFYLQRLVPGSDLAFKTSDEIRGSKAETTSAKTPNPAVNHPNGGLFFMRIGASKSPKSGLNESHSKQDSGRNFVPSAHALARAVFVPLSHPQP